MSRVKAPAREQHTHTPSHTNSSGTEADRLAGHIGGGSSRAGGGLNCFKMEKRGTSRRILFFENFARSTLSLLLLQQTAEGEENEFKGCMEMSEMRRKEMEGTLKPEPLLTENPGRFVLFPIQDNEVCCVVTRQKAFTPPTDFDCITSIRIPVGSILRVASS